MMIEEGVASNTPVVPLSWPADNISTKIEYLHPSGSMKHRSIPPFVQELIDSGELTAGRRLVVRSAGSAAVSLAWAGAQVGCPVTAVLPPSVMSATVSALHWLGADCRIVRPEEAGELMAAWADDDQTYIFAQAGEARLIDHYRAVASELLAGPGVPAAITVGLGTGLSAMGIAREIHDAGVETEVWGVEPAESAIASGEPWAPHRIPGLAPPIDQPLLDTGLLAGIVVVPSEVAWQTAQAVARADGLLIGPSSGATVAAAGMLRQRGVDGPIVAISACAMNDYWDGVID
jgi:cysteine synthase A